MCFVNDYDWCASVVADAMPFAAKPFKCNECGVGISAGDQYRLVLQQEHETCWQCEEDDKDECDCDEPDLGETYTYRCCEECWKFRKAVEAAEMAAGCAVSESSPSYEGMFDEISAGGQEEATKYWRKAVKMFPELRTSGYLRRVWMFS